MTLNSWMKKTKWFMSTHNCLRIPEKKNMLQAMESIWLTKNVWWEEIRLTSWNSEPPATFWVSLCEIAISWPEKCSQNNLRATRIRQESAEIDTIIPSLFQVMSCKCTKIALLCSTTIWLGLRTVVSRSSQDVLFIFGWGVREELMTNWRNKHITYCMIL